MEKFFTSARKRVSMFEWEAAKYRKFFTRKEANKLNNMEEHKNNKIVLLGGYDPRNTTDSSIGKRMISYDRTTDKWSKFGSMPVCRYNMCAVFYDSCIYIIGGNDFAVTSFSAVTPTNDCRKFQLKKKRWVTISPMHYARMFHGVAVVADIIYAVGGVNENQCFMNSIEWYSVKENDWHMLTFSLKVPKIAVGVCSHEGNLWIVGGMNDSKPTEKFKLYKEVEVYNPNKDQMQTNIGDLPSPRAYVSLSECNERIYCIGGATFLKPDDMFICSLKDVCVYSNDLKLWVSVAPLPTPCHRLSTVTFGGAIYSIGGLSTFAPGMLCQDVSEYDQGKGTWTPCAPLSGSNDGICAVGIPTKLYAKAKKTIKLFF